MNGTCLLPTRASSERPTVDGRGEGPLDAKAAAAEGVLVRDLTEAQCRFWLILSMSRSQVEMGGVWGGREGLRFLNLASAERTREVPEHESSCRGT